MSNTFPSHHYPLVPYVMPFVPSVLFCYDFLVGGCGDGQIRLAIWITFFEPIIFFGVVHGSNMMFGMCERKLAYFLYIFFPPPRFITLCSHQDDEQCYTTNQNIYKLSNLSLSMSRLTILLTYCFCNLH